MNESIHIDLQMDGKSLPVDNLDGDGLQFEQESDAWPRSLLLEFDANNEITRNRVSWVRERWGWDPGVFKLNVALKDGALVVTGADECEVVTKYPQAIAVAAPLQDRVTDPRLLGRARFLRDASSSDALPADLRTQIVKPWAALKLQVNEADPTKPDSNKKFCERQGRCFLGCLPGARHTLNKSYLPLAAQNQIDVRPLADVDYVEPLQGGGYIVHYKALEDDKTYHPTAKTVILAAGSLGNTEILLRSQVKTNGKLVLSGALGSRFSTNGHFSGVVTVDRETLSYPIYATRGPINMSHVTFRDGQIFVNVEDAGIPSMFASIVQHVLKMLEPPSQPSPVVSLMGTLWNQAALPDYGDPLTMQTEHEMLMNVSWFNCMGTDDASGRFDFAQRSSAAEVRPPDRRPSDLPQGGDDSPRDRHRHEWPLSGVPVVGRPPAVRFEKTHRDPSPWRLPDGREFDGWRLNGKGQVYNSTTGAQTVYDGLFVADGSTIPGALAVNPTLSIVSQALRVAEAIA